MTFQGATLHYLIVVTLQLKNQPGNGLLGHMKKSKVSLQHYDRLARYAIVLSYLGNRVFQQIWISNFLYLDCRILKKSLVVFKVKIKIRYLLKQLLLTVFIQWFMKSSSSWFWLSILCVCVCVSFLPCFAGQALLLSSCEAYEQAAGSRIIFGFQKF